MSPMRLLATCALMLSRGAAGRALDPYPDTREKELIGWQGEVTRSSSVPGMNKANEMRIEFLSWSNPHLCEACTGGAQRTWENLPWQMKTGVGILEVACCSLISFLMACSVQHIITVPLGCMLMRDRVWRQRSVRGHTRRIHSVSAPLFLMVRLAVRLIQTHASSTSTTSCRMKSAPPENRRPDSSSGTRALTQTAAR